MEINIQEILKKHLDYGNPTSRQDHVNPENWVFTPHVNSAIKEIITEVLKEAADSAETINTYKTRFNGVNKESYIEKDVYKPSITSTINKVKF